MIHWLSTLLTPCSDFWLRPFRNKWAWLLSVVMLAMSCAGEVSIDDRAPSKDLDKPNILWIIAEDLGPELSAYGHPEVQTPNLDQLALNGVRYTHAFTTSPVCSSSRSAFMTGMYQTTIGAHNHRSHREDNYPLPDGVRLITDWLRDADYFTGNIVDLTDSDEEFHYREVMEGGFADFAGTGKTDWNFHYEGEPFDTDRWSDLARNEPFYAQVNFPETHRGPEWENAHKQIMRPANPSAVSMPPYYPDHPEARADWAQYLNSIMSLDRKVGFVLNRLEEDGLADRTVVIFMSDHGRAMVRGKQWPYDSGLHVPLIVRWPSEIPAPKGFTAGAIEDRLIASIDVSATTLAIAGVVPPAKMQGQVFLGEGASPRAYVFSGRDRGDETIDRIRTVRDDQYRYIRNYYPERGLLQLNRYKEFSYPMIPLMRELHEAGQLTSVQAALLAPSRPEEELYDLDVDPFEVDNVAEDPRHAEPLKRLRVALDEWIINSNDQGDMPERPEIYEYWEREMSEIYDVQIKQMLKERQERKTERN